MITLLYPPQTHSSQFQQGLPVLLFFGWNRAELGGKWWFRAQIEHIFYFPKSLNRKIKNFRTIVIPQRNFAG